MEGHPVTIKFWPLVTLSFGFFFFFLPFHRLLMVLRRSCAYRDNRPTKYNGHWAQTRVEVQLLKYLAFWSRFSISGMRKKMEGKKNGVRENNTLPPRTFGEGTTLNEFMILSGYSSRILDMSNVPMPDPVPPPSEWVSWKPWRQSQLSVSLRTTSKTESTSSAPSV